MKEPHISVVVPFFDSEDTIGACIESLLAQEDAGSYEIFMVDNRSTDASATIAGRYRGLTVLQESTPGAYAARNAALRRTRSPIIAFTDADCVVAPDWLRSIREGFQGSDVAILIGHCRYSAEASLALRLLGAYENAKADYVVSRCDPAYHFAYCNNMAVRASVFDELGLFLEWRRAADSELVHRMAARRPDLKLAYRRSMRITHLEFVRGPRRIQRLRLYQSTNSKITTFRELGIVQRLGVLLHVVHRLRHFS